MSDIFTFTLWITISWRNPFFLSFLKLLYKTTRNTTLFQWMRKMISKFGKGQEVSICCSNWQIKIVFEYFWDSALGIRRRCEYTSWKNTLKCLTQKNTICNQASQLPISQFDVLQFNEYTCWSTWGKPLENHCFQSQTPVFQGAWLWTLVLWFDGICMQNAFSAFQNSF